MSSFRWGLVVGLILSIVATGIATFAIAVLSAALFGGTLAGSECFEGIGEGMHRDEVVGRCGPAAGRISVRAFVEADRARGTPPCLDVEAIERTGGELSFWMSDTRHGLLLETVAFDRDGRALAKDLLLAAHLAESSEP